MRMPLLSQIIPSPFRCQPGVTDTYAREIAMPNTILLFDLDTKAAKAALGSVRAAYAQIERVALESGFTRSQGSVYISNAIMSDQQRLVFRQRISDSLPWFKLVAKNARILVVANDMDARGGDPRQLRLPI